jgi:aminoglycoside phosphotransferase (APT) family kinase protein
MERLPGVPLDRWLHEAATDLRRRAGESTGLLLARLAGVPFLRAGRFTDAELTVEPWPAELADLGSRVEARRGQGELARWSAAEVAGLREVADAAQHLLDTDAFRRTCLAHGDFTVENLLVDPADGEITGVVDWEDAHAGTPYTDLGSLLRGVDDEAFVEGVMQTFGRLAPGISANFVERARAADLAAVVDLATRPGDSPARRQARRLLRDTPRCRSLAAGRPSWR